MDVKRSQPDPHPKASDPGARTTDGAPCPPERRAHLDLAASYECLVQIGPVLERLLGPVENLPNRDAVIYQVHLAIHETCTNIIDHAYSILDGKAEDEARMRIQIEMSLLCNPYSLIVDLYDSGAPAAELPPPELPDSSRSHIGGYGLYLIHQLMDKVFYERSPGRNHWRLEKKL